MEEKMNRNQLIAIGGVLVLVILLATACASLAAPKNITITIAETCTMKGPNIISAGKDTPIDIIGNLKDQGKVGVAILTIDPDKTIKDLQDWGSSIQPHWSKIISLQSFPSDGNPYSFDLNVVKGPIYFVCFSEERETPVGALGPIEVKE
jgi:hypothetical protein